LPTSEANPRSLTIRRSGTRQSSALIVGACLMIACVVGVVGWSLWDARQAALDRAVQSAQNLTAALAHDVERNLESYDLSLQGVIDGLKFDEIKSVSPTLRDQILFDRAATAKFLGSVLVLGEQGEVLIDSKSRIPRTTTFEDRDYFRVQRDSADTGLYISPPYKNRQSDEWVIALSRRLEHPDGSFAGVVVGTLKLAFFQNLFDSVDFGPNGATALVSTNQTLVIRKPYVEGEWGRSLRGSALFKQYQTAKAGFIQYRALTDGVDRVAAYQQIGDFPLILSVAVSRDAVFAEWQQKAEIVGAALLFTALLTAALSVFATLELRRRGRAEQAALESETRYRLLADNSSDLIVLVDLNGIRRFVSPASRVLYGYEPEEMMRSDMFGAAHPDDEPLLIAAVERLKAGAESAVVELRAQRKTGDYIWVESHMRLVQDPMSGEARILGQVRDVGQRHAIEQAVRESETQLRTLADSVSDLIILSAPDGERRYVSPSCRAMLGYEPGELQGNPRGTFTHPDDQGHVEARMAAIIAGDEDKVIACRAIRRDGTLVWLEARMSLVRDAATGALVEIVSVMRDISQHKDRGTAGAGPAGGRDGEPVEVRVPGQHEP
jgi:PAS domain S-box-containing protein